MDSDWATGFGLISGLLGHESFLNQPNYHFGMIFYGLSFISSLLGNIKLNKLLSIGGGGAVLFFSYAMFDIGQMCIACIIGTVSNDLVNLTDNSRKNYSISIRKVKHTVRREAAR